MSPKIVQISQQNVKKPQTNKVSPCKQNIKEVDRMLSDLVHFNTKIQPYSLIKNKKQQQQQMTNQQYNSRKKFQQFKDNKNIQFNEAEQTKYKKKTIHYNSKNQIQKQYKNYKSKVNNNNEVRNNSENKLISNSVNQVDQQSQRVQLQIHLTISKQKYTLKLQQSSLKHMKYDLTCIVQNFLIENDISNPSKKNYNKTKQLIISMVEKKIYQRKRQNQQQQIRISQQNKINYEILKQSKKRKDIQNSLKCIKGILHHQNSQFNTQSEEYQQQCYSPNFKSSPHSKSITSNNMQVNKFQLIQSSTLQKSKPNKYQQIALDYYNQNKTHELISKQNHKEQHDSQQEQYNTEKHKKEQQKQIEPKNLHDKSKSVYERWKQKQKQKQNNQSQINHNKSNLKQNKFNFKQNKSELSLKQTHHNKNPPIKFIDLKQKQQGWINNQRNIKNQPKIYQNQNLNFTNKSPLKKINKENNDFYSYSKSPIKNKSLLKSPLKNNKTNQQSYQTNHKKSKELQIQKQSHRKQIQNQNQNNQQQYYQDPSSQSLINQISPDHFYKQGLLFQAKKQIQVQKKFKQLYPFTTKRYNDVEDNLQKAHQQNQRRNTITSKSKSKYSSNANKYSSTSSHNIHTQGSNPASRMNQKQKSQLHERLYKQNSKKQLLKLHNQLQYQAKKLNLCHTQSSKQIMSKNLSYIKGLSPGLKQKLIQKNKQIKQKIREKDNSIDKQLNQMIKQGKIQKPYQITKVSKSPFRKTRVY